jgi:hypothetical protein
MKEEGLFGITCHGLGRVAEQIVPGAYVVWAERKPLVSLFSLK